MQFMSLEWLEAYGSTLNNDAVIAKKLKKFSSSFQYSITDRKDIEPIVMKVEKGVCVEFETFSNTTAKKIDFSVSANTQSWKKVFSHEMNLKEIMSNDGFQFKGPKLKALSNKAGLERSVELMLNMKDVTVE